MQLFKKLACLVSVFILALVHQASAQADKDRIRIGYPEISDESTIRFLEVFRESAERAGVGVDAVAYNPSSAEEILSGILNGGFPVDVALISARTVLGLDSNQTLTYTSLISQPGLIADAAEGFAIQESYIGESVAAELATSGFSVVSFWNRPSTAIAITRRVETAEDLKGVKVISTNPAGVDLLAKLGAAPIQMPFGEVQAALLTGAVDATESNKAFLLQSDFIGQFKEGTVIDNYAQNPGFLIAKREMWLSLSQQARTTIQTSAEDARQASHAVILEGEASLTKAVEESGVFYASVGLEGWQSIGLVAAESWLAGGEGELREDAYSELKAVKEDIKIQKGRGGSLQRTSTQPVITFATNRNDEAQPDLEDRFGIRKNEANPLTCGVVRYDQTSRRSFGEVQPGPLSLKDDQIVVGAGGCSSLVASSVGDGKRITIFFHGYNNTFASAVRRAIGFTQDFQIEGPVVVWSWPSAGLPGEYLYDLNSVQYTEAYVRDFVDALFERGLLDDVTVVAHSMGSRVAGYFLQAVHAKGKQISSIVFAAADYPPSLFKQLITTYGASAGLKTLYANQYDKALAFSRLQNRENPIGLGGYFLELVDSVETVDVSAVARGFGANHAHAFDVEQVAKDVSRLIHEKISADGRSLHPADLNGARYWKIQ